MSVNLCEGYEMDEEILVNYTEKGKQVMILDIGAPVSLSGKEWMEQYLREHGLKMEDIKKHGCSQVFRFGPSKRYESTEMVELPLLVTRMDGKEDVLKVFVYVVEAEVPFLCGKATLESWNAKLDTGKAVLETMIEGERKCFRMVTTEGKHFGIEINCEKENGEEVLYAKEEKEPLDSFKAIRRVHEVTNHKSGQQLVTIHRNAGLNGPKLVKTVKSVLADCKVCQKFGKSMVKPKVAMPRAGSFNEIVMLDLKEFGDKSVLWCIDAFTRFVQGKLLNNKKAETIIEAINECWNMPFGIPSI